MKTLIAEALRRNRVLAVLGLAHFVVFLLLIPMSFIDSTQILGVSRWIKPMKFAISIAIFMLTMTWLLSYLKQSRRSVSVISGIIAFTMTGEMVLITMQSMRNVRSHFNWDTPFDMAVFNVMGLMILMNTIAAGIAWVLFLRRPTAISGAHLSGARFGLVIFIYASLIGGLMAGRGSHGVGVHDGGPGLPFVNWSTSGGDLRVAHFAGMHALQALPVLGWFLTRRRVPAALRWVQLTAVVMTAMTSFLLWQALAGRPLLGWL